jgi:hypothetical protein
MAGPLTVSGGAAHGLASLTHAERQAAQNALAKLKHPGAGLGSHLGRTVESATVSSGSSHPSGPHIVDLGSSTLLSGHGSDTFLGGVRSAPPTAALSIGNDTVVSGSTTKLAVPASSETLAGRGAQHFALSSDTINVAGATAASIQTGHPHGTAETHTVTLADKTTIKIAGLSAHDISKLHH